jgi:hypothetical protein
MKTVDAEEALEQATVNSEELAQHAEEVLSWFLNREGNLYKRSEVFGNISRDVGLDVNEVYDALNYLLNDLVDPLQQVIVDNERLVGVIEYQVWESEGAYGYKEFHDIKGSRKRVVCAHCVKEKEEDSEVVHATEGDGSVESGVDWTVLLSKVQQHISMVHKGDVDKIYPGASLVSGTTVSANTVWHNGNVSGGANINIGSQSVSLNQGSGSGLDADKVDGNEASQLGGSSVSSDSGTLSFTNNTSFTERRENIQNVNFSGNFSHVSAFAGFNSIPGNTLDPTLVFVSDVFGGSINIGYKFNMEDGETVNINWGIIGAD